MSEYCQCKECQKGECDCGAVVICGGCGQRLSENEIGVACRNCAR